ncbi:hypothetical protein DIPPA_05365 [Diplonema papillatum]|nr:hypothetical protein DIPPA_05365 [Diplonema papillatum]
MSAVYPLLDAACTSAPTASNSLTIAALPSLQAAKRAVLPSLLAALTSAPADSKSFTMRSSPDRLVYMSAV